MAHLVNRKRYKRLFFVLFATVLMGSGSVAVADTVSDISNDIFHEASTTQYTWGNGLYLQLSAGRAAWTETDYTYKGGSAQFPVQSDWTTINNSPSYGFEIGYKFPTFFNYLALRTSLSYDDFYDFKMRFDVVNTALNRQHTQYSAPADSKVVLLNLYIDSPNLGSDAYPANFYAGGGIGASFNRFGTSTELNHADSETATITPNTNTAFAAKFDLGVRIKIFLHTYVTVGNKLFYLGEFKSGTTENVITGSGSILTKAASTADDTYVDEPYVGLTIFLGSGNGNVHIL
ncbi:MAG: hypothetical protein GY782_12800 [Gammaproteobacteria bacterium]|nr:hypothetical protein [Gammaproteobacteria bacterium]